MPTVSPSTRRNTETDRPVGITESRPVDRSMETLSLQGIQGSRRPVVPKSPKSKHTPSG